MSRINQGQVRDLYYETVAEAKASVTPGMKIVYIAELNRLYTVSQEGGAESSPDKLTIASSAGHRLVAIAGNKMIPDWDAVTTYTSGAMVNYVGAVWTCTGNAMASSTFQIARFRPIYVPAVRWVGELKDGTAFKRGNVCWYNGKVTVCLSNGTYGKDYYPGTGQYRYALIDDIITHGYPSFALGAELTSAGTGGAFLMDPNSGNSNEYIRGNLSRTFGVNNDCTRNAGVNNLLVTGFGFLKTAYKRLRMSRDRGIVSAAPSATLTPRQGYLREFIYTSCATLAPADIPWLVGTTSEEKNLAAVVMAQRIAPLLCSSNRVNGWGNLIGNQDAAFPSTYPQGETAAGKNGIFVGARNSLDGSNYFRVVLGTDGTNIYTILITPPNGMGAQTSLNYISVASNSWATPTSEFKPRIESSTTLTGTDAIPILMLLTQHIEYNSAMWKN